MSELIRKQDAIDAIQKLNIPEDMCVFEIISHIEVEIATLPSVQPKRGKWIDAVIPSDNGGLLVQVCDQCNTFFPLAYTGGGHHFCPNCGAMMERGEAECVTQ